MTLPLLMDWSERFNQLPKETRHIATMIATEHRISELENDKIRIQRCVSEIDKRIHELKEWMKKNDVVQARRS